MHLTIFKTNVNSLAQSLHLQLLLQNMQSTAACNFDLDDCDKILRLITTDLQPQQICQVLNREGFYCETLESFDYTLSDPRKALAP
jgi:hypothetical protein